ncbi:hypothetical protein LOTGIDRAFT_170951 [Lottia gigantea]|uniref:Uncharacterized protein n=1 Tax=Lottia gigantea TaxID=225164 RepID=V4CPA2_LOTGI|nr:hypothetical protein LOTGIDRAFT_170951 [Lottia gigantea]ESP04255.1 hypothetical protein LOTGIDRAFT_170951 [Lottia gigantea]
MNGTTGNLSSIKPEVIWIPYSFLIVLMIAVLAFSFVRYHRRKITKRKWTKEYADENLHIQRAGIHGITCNSNDMRLVDLGSSMMHPEILRLCTDFSIQSLPNFARHNLELKSSKDTDESVDVNKIVIEDWMEHKELKQMRISNLSAGIHKDTSATFQKDALVSFQKDGSENFDHDLVEIGIDEVCESCKRIVLQYHKHNPHRLKTLKDSLHSHPPYPFETQANSFVPIVNNELKSAEHFCLCKCRCCNANVNREPVTPILQPKTEDVVTVGNERLGEYHDSLIQSESQHTSHLNDNIVCPKGDIYAIPEKKWWSHKIFNDKYVKPTKNTDMFERAIDKVASMVDIDLSQRKCYENTKTGVTNHGKALPKRKRSYVRKSVSKRRHRNSLSMSQAKSTSQSYVSSYHKRPLSQIRIATDYSSTTSSERQSDDEYRSYEEIWSGRNDIGQASNIHNDTFKNQLSSTSRNTKPDCHRSKGCHKSYLPRINFHYSQTMTEKFKEPLNMDSISDCSVNVKMKLPPELQINSSSENSVAYEKWLSRETSQINSNLIEMAKLPGKSNTESNRDPDIQKQLKVDDKRKDDIRSIAQSCHHQLIKCTTLHNPYDQYFNCTDAEKMNQVVPKSNENRTGDIYWLDIHNEDTIV